MGDLASEAAAAHLEAKIAEVRRDRDSARQAVKNLSAERDALAARLALVEQISDLDPHPPKWLAPKRKPSNHHATLCLVLSDLHLDEVVNPAEIGSVNAYDREIATARLQRWAQNVVKVARLYMAGVTFDGFWLALAGDMVSGNIHDELRESNEDTMPGTLLYWSELLSAAIAVLLDEFGKGHVDAVPGNHGRNTHKPRAKGRARDNFDWLMAHLIAREFRDDDRVTFCVPDAFYTHTPIYSMTYRLEHGDQARGGSGWGGPLMPVMRRQQKVETASQAMDQPFDHMVVGHWHSYVCLPRGTINGSLRGYDEFAAQGAFGFEVPQQALWLTTPERGITMRAPVYVADRASEGW